MGEGGSGGPIAFGGDGMLYVAHGGGDTQNPKTLGGKILRLTDEGKVPPDNPFVGRADARPEVFTMGHRTFLRMAKHPLTGAIWQIENGPNGGDEVNILAPGANYGWPLVSLGRTYGGPWQGPFTKEGFRDPIIYWMPAIAVSSITFYTGDRLPKWKGDVFVTGMRYGEIPGTGQLHRILINKNLEELRREPLLVDLRRRYSRREAGPGRPAVSAHRRGRRGDAADRTGGVSRPRAHRAPSRLRAFRRKLKSPANGQRCAPEPPVTPIRNR